MIPIRPPIPKNTSPETHAIKAWIRNLVLQESVVKYWAGLRIHSSCLRNVCKLFKIITVSPVCVVFTAQYIQLFGMRYPYMRLPRVPQVIGEPQVNLARNFESFSKKYFDVSPTTDRLTGTPIYTCFKGDRYMPQVFPRAELLRACMAQFLVSAEMEGIFFPVAILLRTALRKLYFKHSISFLKDIEDEILSAKILTAVTQRCKELSGIEKEPEGRGTKRLYSEH
jgi:hypothetical protein